MNVCKEQTKIAGSQFRTKNKQNRNDRSCCVLPKEKLFPAKYLLSILQYWIFCEDKWKNKNKNKKTKKTQKHKNTKNNLAALAFTETLALLSEGKVNNP